MHGESHKTSEIDAAMTFGKQNQPLRKIQSAESAISHCTHYLLGENCVLPLILKPPTSHIRNQRDACFRLLSFPAYLLFLLEDRTFAWLTYHCLFT